MPARVKHKVRNTLFPFSLQRKQTYIIFLQAITAGVVGGILFFIVAIILSVCAVKICNKRKRRKQEKGKPFAYDLFRCCECI